MARIRELLGNRETYYVAAEMTVQQAARYMLEKNVGAVPVLEGDKLVGVLSERDIVRRILMANRDWTETKVEDVMTSDPLTVKSSDDHEECMLLMKRHTFRHLPVVEEGRLVGFVSLRDLLLYEVDEKDIEVRMMRLYMEQGA